MDQLGDIMATLKRADPADRAEVYAQLGLRLIYQPERRVVTAEARPTDPCTNVCVRGGSRTSSPGSSCGVRSAWRRIAETVPRSLGRGGLYPLWVLIATTGMRRGEALGLRWNDVDLDAGRIRVVQTLLAIGGAVSVGDPKTARGRRSVKLDTGTVAVLRAHRRQSNQERLLVGPDFNDLDLVFHHPDGNWLRPNSVSASFVRRLTRQGLPRITLQGLRHTWATLALERGIHPRVVQERLGHSTIAITLGIYSHVSATLHDEAAQAVADMMLPRP